MDYRKLGSFGVKVSPICLGTAFRGFWHGETDEATCIRVVERAVDLGINFIDCANFYFAGRCEEVLGKALRNLGGKRDDLIITSKVACVPRGCCTPRGKTKTVSDYRSGVSANSGSGFCFWLSTFGTALGADAVSLFVDGTLVAGGSGATLVTSGSNVIASLTMEVGATASAAPTGATLSGSGKVAMSASQTKADGPVQDALNKFGSHQTATVGHVSELQTGGRTLANVYRKAAAAAAQMTYVAGLGQFGVETACGAGTFWIRQALYTNNSPQGRAGSVSFVRRFELLRDQFLPW